MKKFKKVLRFLGLFVMIVLAVFGIGLAGGVPVVPTGKREEATPVKIELVENHREGAEDGETVPYG